ncbi:MAG: glucose-1-phosphate thymidylyltransferase [Dehalococcoidia bacterium]|nr:glucose-1-phosphate thymidylyltransferase [Dehalococcoidia bacterium]
MKGLVISGGKGSRLRPLTYTGAKQLVPIANRPILFHAIDNLRECGIDDITIVVSPETGEQVRAAVGDGSLWGARIGYVEQPQPGGIAQAIGLARDAIGEAPFVVFLGDNFLTQGIVAQVQAFVASDAQAAILMKHVADARAFGVAQFEGERLVRVVEKPQHPASDLAVIGIYLFTTRVFEAIDRLVPSARGELEITDTIQRLIDDGCEVRAEVVEGEWIDTGKHDDLLAANRAILETIADDRSGGVVSGASTLHGRVVLQPGCEVTNSVISGPAIIGEGTVVRDAYIGPFTSIGAACTIVESEIAGSVVMDGTTIAQLPARIENSLIGRNVELRSDGRKPHGYELVLGDYSRARLP